MVLIRNGLPGVGVDTQGLESQSLNAQPQSTTGTQLPVERRRWQAGGFYYTCTHYGRFGDADDQLGNGLGDQIAVLGDRMSYLSFQASKRLRVFVVRLL